MKLSQITSARKFTNVSFKLRIIYRKTAEDGVWINRRSRDS